MDMILLDWTRMGRSYCVAGAVLEKADWRIVRPLLMKHRAAPVRNVGWSGIRTIYWSDFLSCCAMPALRRWLTCALSPIASATRTSTGRSWRQGSASMTSRTHFWAPFLFDGHSRWEIFELIGAAPAAPEPPHLEDLWVRALRPRRQSASPEQRRAILAATTGTRDAPLFGAPFVTTRTAAYLPPGTGQRSLTTVKALSRLITFTAARRAGAPEPDIRATLPVPGLDDCHLPVKDHQLLARCEVGARSLEEQVQRLSDAVRQMGEQVAVRLGLSRAFMGEPGQSPVCWLMADGFFSLTDPQP